MTDADEGAYSPLAVPVGIRATVLPCSTLVAVNLRGGFLKSDEVGGSADQAVLRCPLRERQVQAYSGRSGASR